MWKLGNLYTPVSQTLRPSLCPPPMVSRYNFRTDFKFCTVVWYHKIQIKFEFQCDQIIGSKVVKGKDFRKWVTCGKYWRIRELKRQKGIVKCNWELKKMVQIVGNLEWELFIKMWKLGNLYTSFDTKYHTINVDFVVSETWYFLVYGAVFRDFTKSTLMVPPLIVFSRRQ
jgi:hypothetical protein